MRKEMERLRVTVAWLCVVLFCTLGLAKANIGQQALTASPTVTPTLTAACLLNMAHCFHMVQRTHKYG
jgi:hypothetical protein